MLELAVTKKEQIPEQRHKEWENSQEVNNAESKFLICLQGELYAVKIELLAFMLQVKGMKDDILHANDLVFKEHISRDSER